jgi:mannose-1-phosphate guanylyltransferase
MLPVVTPKIPVMILAAGLGTRLAPLSSWRPKALVPIGDRGALAHVVDGVRGVARGIVVNAHHRADEVEAFARRIGIAVSREEELLGTAGGVRAAEGMLGAGSVLVWNSDMVGPLDAPVLIEAHASGAGALATLAVRLCEPGARGNVGLDEDGRVVRLRGETAVPDAKPETRAAEFVGVHVVGEELRRALPRAGCLVGDVYLPAMRRGGRIASLVIDAEMIDIGTTREYLRANLRWLAGRGERVWCGEGVNIAEGATLEAAIVGNGARVVGAGRVESCVVWPGAEAVAPIANAIVTPDGVVHLGT